MIRSLIIIGVDCVYSCCEIGLTGVTQQISSKVDFGEEESTAILKNPQNEEDVEVQHTIVVSTKLKNNNRRGLHSDGNIALFFKVSQ